MTLEEAMRERGMNPIAPAFRTQQQPDAPTLPRPTALVDKEQALATRRADQEAQRAVKAAQDANARLDNANRKQAFRDRGVDFNTDVTGRPVPIDSENNRAAGVAPAKLRMDGRVDPATFDENKVLSLPVKPVESPEMVALRTAKSKLGEVARYQKLRVDDFDKGAGALLGYDKKIKAETGPLSEIDQLEAQSADSVGTVMGALTPGVSAGDPTEKAKQARAQLDEIMRQAQKQNPDIRTVQDLKLHRESLRQERQRIVEAAARADTEKRQAELAYGAKIAERYGIPSTATPATLLKTRAALKQAGAEGDEEAARVLAQKATQDFAALDESAQKRVAKFEPTFWSKVGDLGLSLASGAQDVLEGIDTLVSDFTPLGSAYRAATGKDLRPIQAAADFGGAVAGAVTNAVEGRPDFVGDVLSVNPGENRSTVLTDLQSKDIKDREAARQAAVAAAGEDKTGIARQAAKAWASVKGTFSDPTLLANTMIRQLPQLVPSEAAAGIAAKLAPLAKAEKYAKLASIGAGALMQGADVADDTRADISSLLEKMSAEQAASVPDIAKYINSGLTLSEAKAQFVLDQTRLAGGLGAVASFAANSMPGSVEHAIGRLVAGTVNGAEKPGVASIAKGVVKGALGEIPSEVTEETAGQVAKNIAARPVDPNRSLLEGTGDAAGQATVGAVGMGGVTGAREGMHRAPGSQHGGAEQPAPDIPPTPDAPAPSEPQQAAPTAPTENDPFNPALDDELAAEVNQSTARMEEGQAAQTEPAPATPAPPISTAPVETAPEANAAPDNSQPEPPMPSEAENITREPAQVEQPTQGVAGEATQPGEAPAPVSEQEPGVERPEAQPTATKEAGGDAPAPAPVSAPDFTTATDAKLANEAKIVRATLARKGIKPEARARLEAKQAAIKAEQERRTPTPSPQPSVGPAEQQTPQAQPSRDEATTARENTSAAVPRAQAAIEPVAPVADSAPSQPPVSESDKPQATNTAPTPEPAPEAGKVSWANTKTVSEATTGERRISEQIGTLTDISGKVWKVRIRHTPLARKGAYAFVFNSEGATDALPFNINPRSTIAEAVDMLQGYFNATEVAPGSPRAKVEIAADYATPESKDAKKDATAKQRDEARFLKRFGRGLTEAERSDWSELQALEARTTGKTANEEKLQGILSSRLAADIDKWEPGMGVQFTVASAGRDSGVRRGYRVREVDRNGRRLLVQQVRDTGITTTGGGAEVGSSMWIDLAGVKRDRASDAASVSTPSPRPADVSKNEAKADTSPTIKESLTVAPAPIVARGQNKPAEFVKAVAKATGLKGTDAPIRAMIELSNRLHRAAPANFESMEVLALSEAEWKDNPATGRQTPDSAAAYNPETNTLYLRTERVKQPTALVSAIVHEAGHFAERFALPEALVAREWAKLDDAQIEQAAADYNPDDTRTAAKIRQDPRARSEWVAQQFARVVAGKAKTVPAGIRAKLQEFFDAMKAFATKWIGSEFASSPAFDREVLRVMGFDEDGNKVAEAAPTTTEPPASPTTTPSAPSPSLPAAGGVTAPAAVAETAPGQLPKVGEVFATEQSNAGAFEYAIVKGLYDENPSYFTVAYRRVGGKDTWESALMGHRSTMNAAVERFVERMAQKTADGSVAISNPEVKSRVDAVNAEAKAKADAEAAKKSEEDARAVAAVEQSRAFQSAIDAVELPKGKAKATFEVRDINGKSYGTKTGTQFGPWAIVKNEGNKQVPYDVYHVPSGLRGQGARTYQEGMSIIRGFILAGATSNDPALVKDKDMLKRMAGIIQFIKNGIVPDWFTPATATPPVAPATPKVAPSEDRPAKPLPFSEARRALLAQVDSAIAKAPSEAGFESRVQAVMSLPVDQRQVKFQAGTSRYRIDNTKEALEQFRKLVAGPIRSSYLARESTVLPSLTGEEMGMVRNAKETGRLEDPFIRGLMDRTTEAQFKSLGLGETHTRVAPGVVMPKEGAEALAALKRGEQREFDVMGTPAQNDGMATGDGAAQQSSGSPQSGPKGAEGVQLFRASDRPEAKGGAHFTETRRDAEAYTDNPGFGGPNVYEYRVTMTAPLKLSQRNAYDLRSLAEAVGEINGLEREAISDLAQSWKDSGYTTVFQVLENARGVERDLSEKHDWIRFIDDFPEGSTTWKYLGGDALSPNPARTGEGAQSLGTPGERQTETPEFKRWFGKSKVVDEQGKPRRMYHGTDSAGFSVFDSRTPGVAGYFTDAPGMANNYSGTKAGAGTYPVYLAINRPFDLSQVDEEQTAATWVEVFREAGLSDWNMESMPEDMRDRPDDTYRFWEIIDPIGGFVRKNQVPPLVRALKEAGYDGIFIPSERRYFGDFNAVPFSSSQIKSAIGNRGTFDPSNPDILGTPAEGKTESDPVPLTDAEKDAARRELAGEEASTVLNPPKNAEVPGTDGARRYRSHTDTAIERGWDAIRTTYPVFTNETAKRAATDFIEAAGESAAAEAVFRKDSILPGPVLVATGVNLETRLQERIAKATTPEEKQQAKAQFDRLSERLAEIGTASGQTSQAFDLVGKITTTAGAMHSATQQAKSRQDTMLGKDGLRTEKEIVDAMNGENSKVIDALLADVKADVRKVKVTKKMVERSVGELPKNKKELDRAIRDAFEETDRRISDIIRTHHTTVDAIGTSLVDKLTQEAGLSQADAEKLAEAVRLRLAARTEKAKRDVLNRLAREKSGVSRRVFTLVDKIVEMSNSGALDRPALRSRIAEELKLPRVTDALAQRLKDLTDKAQRTPDGFQRDRVETDIMDELRKVKGVGPIDIVTAAYYANILSGYTTQIVNIISTGLNVSADLVNEVTRAEADALIGRNGAKLGRATKQALAGFADGARTGFTQAASILSTGYAAKAFDEKLPEVSPILELIAKEEAKGAMKGVKGYAMAARYVTRAMKAADTVFFRSASEAYQRVAAAKLAGALDRGMDRAEANRKIRDMLAISPADFESARRQAREEGLTGLDYNLRVSEIIHQRRSPAITSDAARFAQAATFNNAPQGMLGIIARNVGQTAKSVPALKLFVPFTNIVANVTNASLNYSPLGIVRAGVIPGTRTMLDETGNARVELNRDQRGAQLVKGLAGTMAMVALLAYGLAGDDDDTPIISATGPKDTDRRNQLRRSGWKPHTIKIGNTYVSYLTSPAAVPLAFVGNWIDAIRYNGLSEKDLTGAATQAAVGIGSTITDMSFLRGVADLFDTLRGAPGASPEKWAAGVATSALVPNLVKQIDQTFDPTLRQAKTLGENVASAVPGLRQQLPARLTPTGTPIESSPIGRFGGIATNDPLWDTLNAKGAVISDVKSAKINNREATPEELRLIVQESGPRIEQRLRAALPAIQRMSSEKASDYVKDVAREERARARQMLPVLIRRNMGPPVFKTN